jgi:ABC-type Na+ efflux pump permease subunit
MRTALKRSLFSLFPPVLILLLFFAVIAFPSVVFAHRLDEYLQATLVVLEPNSIRLQMNLTPGVTVAEQVLSQIDIDHDGTISTNEATAYCKLLKRDLSIRIDQQDLKLNLVASYFPGLDELRTGWGFIQIEFSATHSPFSAGTHKLIIENRHLSDISVYLLNATRPQTSSIQIAAQVRNENQSAGEIQFSFQPQGGSSKAAALVAVLLIILVGVSLGATRRSTTSHHPPSLSYFGRLRRRLPKPHPQGPLP